MAKCHSKPALRRQVTKTVKHIDMNRKFVSTISVIYQLFRQVTAGLCNYSVLVKNIGQRYNLSENK